MKQGRGKTFRWMQVHGLLLSTWLAMPLAVADATPAQRWVQGSWVNVRQETAADSAVTGHLVANTRVSLLEVGGKTCRVAWGEDAMQQGYVACRFLGESPLDFGKISERWGNDGENAGYAPDKAFWMRPSLARLLEAGQKFQRRFRSEQEAKATEGGFSDTVPKLVRYPVPEFEAMKAMLAQGIVPAVEQRPQMPLLAEVLKKAAIAAKEGSDYLQIDDRVYVSALVLAQLQAVKLPAAKPSLFRQLTDFAPPRAGVEAIAAQFGLMETAVFKGGMHWICSRVADGCFFTGVWDIGAYSLQLQKPVYLQAIDRRGLMTAMEYPGVYQNNYTDEDYEETCRSDLLAAGLADAFKRGNREGRYLPGYPRLKSPLFWFFTPAPLDAKVAGLRSYKVKANGSRLDQSLPPELAVYEVDIDGDKTADFVLVSGALGGVAVMDGWFHLLLANVAGEWVLASSGEDTDCT